MRLRNLSGFFLARRALFFHQELLFIETGYNCQGQSTTPYCNYSALNITKNPSALKAFYIASGLMVLSCSQVGLGCGNVF
jgi:hypothetical protein